MMQQMSRLLLSLSITLLCTAYAQPVQYDRAESLLDWLGVGRLHRELLQKVSGDVLEVAVGTGKNLPHYPGG